MSGEDAGEARRRLLQKRLAERRGTAGEGPARLPRAAYPLHLPASPGQARLVLLERLAPVGSAYNETVTIRLRGPLDAARLSRSLEAVAARHEALRTSLVERDGQVAQRIEPPGPVPLPLVALPGGGDPADRLAAAVAAEAAKPFDLARGPLFRATLYRLEEAEHVLLLVCHHAVVDGWSGGVLLRDLAAAYGNGGASPTGEPPLQYADFAAWQRARLSPGRRAALVEGWRARLLDTPTRLDLPADRPRPAVQGFAAVRVARRLGPDEAAAVRGFARARGVTPFLVLLTAVQVLLHRLTGQERFLLGAPSSGRLRPELEDVVGFFVNNLVFPADLSGEPRLEELLARNREMAGFALTAQELPFEELVEALRPVRDPARPSLFQVFVNHLSIGNEPREAGDLRFEPVPRPSVEAKFDLTVYAADEGERLRLELVAARSLFDEPRVEAMAESLERALAGLAADAARPASALALAGPRSQAVHPGPGELAPAGTLGAIPAAFRERARATPGRLALRSAAGETTCAALLERAASLAATLAQAGIGPGDLVALRLERSEALVAGVLGVLEAGAAFLVLDPAHPKGREADVLARARPRALLHRPAPGEAIRVEALGGPAAKLDPGVAYAAVTSGTTGRPQVVLGTHAPVVQFLRWQREAFGLREDDRFALLSGLGHDPLLRDVFAPLSIGATLAIPEEEALRDPEALLAWLRDERVSVVHATPGLLRLLLAARGATERGLAGLRLVFAGGDVLRAGDVRRLRQAAPAARVVNLYGTTETPQGVAFFEAPDPGPESDAADARPVPVGRGREGVDLLVLDAGGRLAAIGELGEVGVRTPYLTEGYLGEPELTRARFVSGTYRTGDLGRYEPDGAVLLAGRADRQLKRRGYRLDPAEVEAALVSHPAVSEAAVVENGEGDAARLVAFVVPGDGPPAPAEELRAFLRARLPEPFVPADVVALDRLPLTPNGKLDARALPFPSRAPAEAAGAPLVPGDPVVDRLAAIWGRLLGVAPASPDDDFFALGGHSLLAAEMATVVRREMGADLTLASFFAAPTLRATAELVEQGRHRAPFSALVRFREGDARAPLFLAHPHSGTLHRCRPLIARLPADLPVYGLQSRALDPSQPIPGSFAELAARHVEDVRRLVGGGVCHLGGHSLGGAIAFEMATQIEAAGGRVGRVLLFDTWRPDLERVKPHVLHRVGLRLRNIARARPDERHAYVREWLTGVLARRGLLPGVPAEPQLPPMLETVRRINSEAARTFVRRRYGGAVTLFRARVRLTDRYDHADNGWGELCTAGLEIVLVDGDHESLVAEPHAQGLAREIARRIG